MSPINQTTTNIVAGTPSKVADTASKVADTASKVAGTASKVAGTASKMAGTASKVAGTASKMAGTASKVTGTASKVTGTASKVTGTASKASTKKVLSNMKFTKTKTVVNEQESDEDEENDMSEGELPTRNESPMDSNHTRMLTRCQEEEDENQRHLHTTQILADLRKAELGYALLHVGDTPNDFGLGPNMVRQRYNCRPINKQVISRIRHSHNSTALLNRFPENAMFIGIKKNYAIKESLSSLRAGPYNNFIKWTEDARSQGAQMVLFNGNHRWTYIGELCEQEFYDYMEAMKEIVNWKNPRDKNGAIEIKKKNRVILEEKAVWLARFFDIDALEAASNSALLLHELTTNLSLPAKDDTDTDKLKNVLRLGRGGTSEKSSQLVKDALKQWIESKDSSSSRTAWAVSDYHLFNFLQDLYAHPAFENSALINISLMYSNWAPNLTWHTRMLTEEPMLALLEFLVSPVILPTMQEAWRKYHSKNCDLAHPNHAKELKHVMKKLTDEFQDPILEAKNAPLLGLLDGPIMEKMDEAFSEHLSAHMHLYGSSDISEMERYQQGFIKYHRAISDDANKVIEYDMLPYCNKTSDGGERERATIRNVIVKMTWCRLGFKPSYSIATLDVQTPEPFLSTSVIGAVMLNWNAKRVSRYMKVPRGEPKIKEVAFFGESVAEIFLWIEPLCVFAVTGGNLRGPNKAWHCAGGAIGHYFKVRMGISNEFAREQAFGMLVTSLHMMRGAQLPQLKAAMEKYMPSPETIKKILADIKDLLTKDVLAQLKKFIRKYGNEISLTKNASKGALVLPRPSKLLQDEFNFDATPKLQKAFESLWRILRQTSFRWIQSDPTKSVSNAFIIHCIYQANLQKRRIQMLATPTVWSIREAIASDLVAIAHENGHPELEVFPFWDRIVTMPVTPDIVDLISILPVINDAETFASSSARALAAPDLAKTNKDILTKIVKLAISEGLGGIKINGVLKIEPGVKNALVELIEASRKQALRVNDPKADLTAKLSREDRTELVQDLGFGFNMDRLKVATVEELDRHFSPQSDLALKKKPISFHSTDTRLYTAYLAEERLSKINKAVAHNNMLQRRSEKRAKKHGRPTKLKAKSKPIIESEDEPSDMEASVAEDAEGEEHLHEMDTSEEPRLTTKDKGKGRQVASETSFENEETFGFGEPMAMDHAHEEEHDEDMAEEGEQREEADFSDHENVKYSKGSESSEESDDSGPPLSSYIRNILKAAEDSSSETSDDESLDKQLAVDHEVRKKGRSSTSPEWDQDEEDDDNGTDNSGDANLNPPGIEDSIMKDSHGEDADGIDHPDAENTEETSVSKALAKAFASNDPHHLDNVEMQELLDDPEADVKVNVGQGKVLVLNSDDEQDRSAAKTLEAARSKKRTPTPSQEQLIRDTHNAIDLDSDSDLTTSPSSGIQSRKRTPVDALLQSQGAGARKKPRISDQELSQTLSELRTDNTYARTPTRWARLGRALHSVRAIEPSMTDELPPVIKAAAVACSKGERQTREAFCRWMKGRKTHPTDEEIIVKAQACFGVGFKMEAGPQGDPEEVKIKEDLMQVEEDRVEGSSKMNVDK
ncbi:hypothetical protein BDR07DRAFT_1568407 [Suillus spraguei]|nr:hypothetical protein BDR07DRAFT_1568407 [Suillus spraguei]